MDKGAGVRSPACWRVALPGRSVDAREETAGSGVVCEASRGCRSFFVARPCHSRGCFPAATLFRGGDPGSRAGRGSGAWTGREYPASAGARFS